MRDNIFSSEGGAVELRNCLTEAEQARAERNYHHQVDIQAKLDDGLFVVTCSFPVYCKSTDACCGEDTTMAKAFDTRSEAEEFVANIYNEAEAAGYTPEEQYNVLPREVQAPDPEPVPYNDDDGIPF